MNDKIDWTMYDMPIQIGDEWMVLISTMKQGAKVPIEEVYFNSEQDANDWTMEEILKGVT